MTEDELVASLEAQLSAIESDLAVKRRELKEAVLHQGEVEKKLSEARFKARKAKPSGRFQ